jgi:hypothetical protein
LDEVWRPPLAATLGSGSHRKLPRGQSILSVKLIDVRLSDRTSSPERVLAHPRHQATQAVLAQLIEQLRACTTVRDGYDFQMALLDQVLDVETDRNAFSQALKRLKVGKQPQAGVPDLQSEMDPAAPEAWRHEIDVCERVARQLRCIGDGLAWRVFGFKRQYILALCRNQSPGVMAGKVGLAAERARVEQIYKDDGQFAILHDLTNCLRIGDITVFGDGRPPETIEIKTDIERRTPAQRRRITAARQALQDLGPLPGDNRGERLYDLEVSFKTHLSLLRTATARAAQDGIFTVKVPGNRALIAADMYGCQAQGWAEADFGERIKRQYLAALRRAGIGGQLEYTVNATSFDSVSRDPLRVPFAAYPLHPIACARLIGDIAIFTVATSGLALADALYDAGIDAEWVRPPGTDNLRPGEVVMDIRAMSTSPLRGTVVMELSRTLQMRRSELDRYLIECIEQDTWFEGIRYLLTGRPLMPRQPWPYYRDEYETWR